MSFEFADCEPLLPDSKVEKIQEKLKREFPAIGDAVLVSYVQPRQALGSKNGGGPADIEEVAVFAIISQNPKEPQYHIMTKAAVYLSEWRDVQKTYGHFVAKADPAYRIFHRTCVEHAKTMQNLREMN